MDVYYAKHEWVPPLFIKSSKLISSQQTTVTTPMSPLPGYGFDPSSSLSLAIQTSWTTPSSYSVSFTNKPQSLIGYILITMQPSTKPKATPATTMCSPSSSATLCRLPRRDQKILNHMITILSWLPWRTTGAWATWGWVMLVLRRSFRLLQKKGECYWRMSALLGKARVRCVMIYCMCIHSFIKVMDFILST